jgi:hypothetical protein
MATARNNRTKLPGRVGLIAAVFVVAGFVFTSCVKRPGKTIDQLNSAELELLRTHCLQFLATNSYVLDPDENARIFGAAYFVTNVNLRQELAGWRVMLHKDSTNHPQHISLWAMGFDTREHIIVGARDFIGPTNEGWRMITNGIYKFGN